MRPVDITKETVQSYLKDHGLFEAQVFGAAREQLDPIDRHIVMRDLFSHFTNFNMTNEGLTYVDHENQRNLIISNMKDFEQIDTIEHCITTMKYIGYVREARIPVSREPTQAQRKGQEYERY